jgi:methane monooxygenase component A beta chain/propane monooxygenase small subunit
VIRAPEQFVDELGGVRDLAYIRPQGRRLSEYEAVTCYIQPSAHGGGLQTCGDLILRPDGRPLFDPGSTSLQVADWFAFRDPNRLWQRPYYAEQSRAEQAIEMVTDVELRVRGAEGMEPGWLTRGLEEAFAAFAHVEYGLYWALNSAARESLSDTVNNVLLFNAADKLRHAQAIAILGFDLERARPGFNGERGRVVWLEEDGWQPVRRLVEEVMAIEDWGEIVVAVNGAVEPLLGEPLRRIAFSAIPARRGDTLTPVVTATATRDWMRNARWTDAFLRFTLEADAMNEARLRGWLDKWSTQARATADHLAEVLAERLREPGLPRLMAAVAEKEQQRMAAPFLAPADRSEERSSL